MKKRKLFIIIPILIVIIAFVNNINQNKYNDVNTINLKEIDNSDFDLITEDYLYDFNYAYDILEKYYPFFEINKMAYGIDWLSNKDDYENYIRESKNDWDFYNRMNDVLAELNNGHTGLIDESFAMTLYISYYHTPKADWRHVFSKIYKKENVRKRYNINNQSIKNYIKENIDNHSENSSDIDNLTTDIIINNKLAYMKVNSMLGDLYRKNDEKVLAEFLQEIKNYSNLIIDIRGNGGGDSRYWQEFLLPKILDDDYQTINYSFIKAGDLNSKVIKQEGYKSNIEEFIENSAFNQKTKDILKDFDYYLSDENYVEAAYDTIGFKGNIYLLVDEGVYSSAEMLASFCKETKIATLVGTRTGGDGIGFDPLQVDLPKTGYVLRFSGGLGLTGSGSINELDKTKPDIEVKEDFTTTTKPLKDQEIIKAVIKDAGITWFIYYLQKLYFKCHFDI